MLMRTANLREWRCERKLTRSQLAQLVGVTASAIGMYETGRRVPNVSMARRLADALGVLVDQIEWPERVKKGA